METKKKIQKKEIVFNLEELEQFYLIKLPKGFPPEVNFVNVILEE